MRVKIIPHGHLRQIWPTGYEVEADTAWQAMNAYLTQHNLGTPGDINTRWRVRVVGCDSVQALHSPIWMEELHIVPDFSGGGGFVKIIIGVVEIVAGVLLWNTPFGVPLVLMGVTTVIGGILELLSPSPKTNHPTDDSNLTRYLGAPKNTVKTGTRTPVGFGRYQVYGHFLSFRIDGNAVAAQPSELRR